MSQSQIKELPKKQANSNYHKQRQRKRRKATNRGQQAQSKSSVPFRIIYIPPLPYTNVIRFTRTPVLDNLGSQNQDEESPVYNPTDLIYNPSINSKDPFIQPGVNKISHGDWKFIQQQPQAKLLIAQGKLIKVEGHGRGNPTDTLEDFDPIQAQILIDNTFDMELLQQEEKRERRMEIARQISLRIQKLEAERANKQLPLMET